MRSLQTLRQKDRQDIILLERGFLFVKPTEGASAASPA
jgi:hypothetical protein